MMSEAANRVLVAFKFWQHRRFMIRSVEVLPTKMGAPV